MFAKQRETVFLFQKKVEITLLKVSFFNVPENQKVPYFPQII